MTRLQNNNRPTLEQQAARVAREAANLDMDAPTLQVLMMIYNQLTTIQDDLADLRQALDSMNVDTETREWFDTSDVAELLGLTRAHVTERLCNQGRIECEKYTPEENRKSAKSSKWRIPRHEYERLRRGGKPLPSSPGRKNAR